MRLRKRLIENSPQKYKLMSLNTYEISPDFHEVDDQEKEKLLLQHIISKKKQTQTGAKPTS